MKDYDFIYPESDHSFWVYSENMDIDYLVSLNQPDDLEDAKAIAEWKVTKWAEANNENNPNWYKGFVEVVEEALSEADIDARIYVRMEG